MSGCLFAEGGTKILKLSTLGEHHWGTHTLQKKSHVHTYTFLELHPGPPLSTPRLLTNAFEEGVRKAVKEITKTGNLSFSLRHAQSACRQITNPPSRPIRQLLTLLPLRLLRPSHVLIIRRRRVQC